MKLSSGTKVLDCLLEGGFDSDILTTIYGPAATGKTTCCLLTTINTAKNKGKTLFIDTENGFSVERLKQLTPEYKLVLENIFLIKVNSFDEQVKKIKEVGELVKRAKIDLLIIDTIGSQYRNVLKDDVYNINKEMDLQLRILNDIAKNTKTTVLMTNQVYTNIENKETILVGGEMLKGWSKCLIELKNLKGDKRIAALKKHPNLKEKEVLFEIVKEGFIKS